MEVPFGQMTQREFDALVAQEMRRVNPHHEDASQVARDRVARQANQHEGRGSGSVAYRPRADTPAQSAPTPSAAPRNAVDASIDASIAEPGTEVAPLTAAPVDRNIERAPIDGETFQGAPVDRNITRAPLADALVDESMVQSDQSPDRGWSAGEYIAALIGTAGGAAALQNLYQRLQNGDMQAADILRVEGIDAEEFMHEMEQSATRGGRSAEMPTRPAPIMDIDLPNPKVRAP